ncbi:MAG: hypothetical protein C4519_21180 [Desulfobacteraceae bacterium]|nr:MAG: hypothetical protein C4519_21180 [Desulfobacteraceae bacterium]
MGVFDVPAPLFGWLDGLAAVALPSWLRLVLWGGVAGLVSMVLYRQLSAQERISAGKRKLSQTQHRLNAFDGELKEAWPLMREMLLTALRQVARVGWPAILASVPLLILLNWLSTEYGHAYPSAGMPLQIRTVPEQFKASWIEPNELRTGKYPHIVVVDGDNRIVADARLDAPVPVIHKRRWWNSLIANPAGYLPDDAPVERIQARLPRQQHLSFGPNWMRGWEIIFFAALLVVSIVLKTKLKIA